MIIVEYSPVFGMRIFTGFKEPTKQDKVDYQHAHYQLRQTSRRIKSKMKK